MRLGARCVFKGKLETGFPRDSRREQQTVCSSNSALKTSGYGSHRYSFPSGGLLEAKRRSVSNNARRMQSQGCGLGWGATGTLLQPAVLQSDPSFHILHSMITSLPRNQVEGGRCYSSRKVQTVLGDCDRRGFLADEAACAVVDARQRSGLVHRALCCSIPLERLKAANMRRENR